jgi:chorismate dehydratase
VDAIHADTDSHTSIALLRVAVQHMLGRQPRIIAYDAREQVAENRVVRSPRAVLLIGDKVVTAAPDESDYPHTLDLGEAWKAMTGLPFVFAIWMARTDAVLGDVAERLAAARVANLENLDALIDHYAAKHGWPVDLARQYLGERLRFGVGEREVEAMRRFGELAAEHGVIDEARPLVFAK